MPSYSEHLDFVRSKPYDFWGIIYNDVHEPVGSVYVTKDNEIGIFILKEHRGKGYGSKVIRHLILLNDDKIFRANINPANKESIKFFECLGFKLVRKEEKQLVYQICE
jgi:RimJ/RimL family protein N-acetyltransferase